MSECKEIKKIGILTSPDSWFLHYARWLCKYIRWFGYPCDLYSDHLEIKESLDILFILSYFKIVPGHVLKKNKHNLVVHESDLPHGKGWSPLFWQILEGKNKIPIVLFEATDKVDSGLIYLKDFIELEGHELHDEIREKQAEKTAELCIRFLREYESLTPTEPVGLESFYRRRTPEDSRLNIDKTIEEQFNLLRIVSNEEYPAFFEYNGYRYILKIYKANGD